MIVKFATYTDKRQARLSFAHDEVFLITHEALLTLTPTMSVEEMYATARALADDLVRNDLSEREMLLYEVNDLREEVGDELSSRLILILAFMRLGALRKTHPNAEAIARALCGYCMDYPEFSHLRQAFAQKEKSRWCEGKRINLYTYELDSLAHGATGLDEARCVVDTIVDVTVRLTPEAIQHVLVPLQSVNEQYGGAFREHITRLHDTIERKTERSVIIKEQTNHGCVQTYGPVGHSTFQK